MRSSPSRRPEQKKTSLPNSTKSYADVERGRRFVLEPSLSQSVFQNQQTSAGNGFIAPCFSPICGRFGALISRAMGGSG